jgi:hypothetical protein
VCSVAVWNVSSTLKRQHCQAQTVPARYASLIMSFQYKMKLNGASTCLSVPLWHFDTNFESELVWDIISLQCILSFTVTSSSFIVIFYYSFHNLKSNASYVSECNKNRRTFLKESNSVNTPWTKERNLSAVRMGQQNVSKKWLYGESVDMWATVMCKGGNLIWNEREEEWIVHRNKQIKTTKRVCSACDRIEQWMYTVAIRVWWNQ